ncbi:hypothetical protein B9Z55_007997 [Caenorhabditis nigoni]|uniref:Uncharacterized protein n=1 Tax=Caenorhabditis nigoni TaxID=1611254 RepID=A0A2G5VC77_9PELO|nr:hypothetical protein B9Z55_007997 [Caenorhabditis nigoni]
MLSTLSSICVMEYLEYLSFEKRQYIVSQIPGLRKVEKSLPHHLDYLNIAFDRIRINEYEYYLTNKGSGTIEIRKRQIPYPPNDLLGLESPNYENVQVAIEKLVNDLIGDRPMIYTKKLEFWDSWIFRIPFDLKIQAESIEARWFNLRHGDLDRISNFLGPKPLKEFSTKLDNYEIFTHPIVRNSQKLVIWRGSLDSYNWRVNHRNIHLKDYDRETLYRLMNEWIASDPKIGMELTGDIKRTYSWKLIEEEIWIKERMYLIKCGNHGIRVKPDWRLYIVSQIPGFRKVEKSLPLRLDTLLIEFDRIQIDEYKYYLTGRFRRPLDFSPTGNPSASATWTIELRKRQIHTVPVSDTLLGLVPPIYGNNEKASEKLLFDLIGNRPMIYTKKLELLNFTGQKSQHERSAMISRLPSGLKIQAEIIRAFWNHFSDSDLYRISDILGPKPLKEFSTAFWDYATLAHPIVRNSQKLVLTPGTGNFDARIIIHKHIHLKYYWRPALINHMTEWAANVQEIGMEFSGDIINELEEKSIKELMYLKKCESGGRRVKPDERQYIVSQIPELRTVEKSLPLNLDNLSILDNRIRIDEYEYWTGIREKEYYLSNNSQISWTIELRKRRIQNSPIDGTVLGLLPPIYDDNIKMASEKLILDLIGNRPMIYTKKLEFRNLRNYRLPDNLKIQADIFETRPFNYSYADLDRLANILGPKPLKEFSTQLKFRGFGIFTHPIVQNSQKLVLWRGGEDFDPRRINHKNVHLKSFGQWILIRCMNAWIANVQEVGMEFSGDIQISGGNYPKLADSEIDEEEKSLKEMMHWRKCEGDGRRVKADKRFPNTLYSISVPWTNNPNTEMQMSLIKSASIDSQFQIHLKIQPSGTAIPERFDSMYWELKLWKTQNQIISFFSSESLPDQLLFGSMCLLCFNLFILRLDSIISKKIK